LARRRSNAIVIELHGLLDVSRQHFLGGQVLDAGDLAEVAHRFAVDLIGRHQQFRLPEIERAMGLEGRHAAHHALVHKVREAPLHGLFHVRASGMHHRAQVFKNGCAKSADLAM
jgi:hypothetical protein